MTFQTDDDNTAQGREVVTLARHAMATRFEIVLHGAKASRLRAAGEEALDEIDRLEGLLSLYRAGSDIGRVNAMAARQPVRVSPPVFALLQHARKLHEESGGAFDISVAPLVRCWGFMHGEGRVPSAEEISEARDHSGMRHVILREESFTVSFDREGVMLDLGAIGKGYAIDQAASLLREAGVSSALIHGGTSTVYALGKPRDAAAWKIAIECPPAQSEPKPVSAGAARKPLRAIVSLEDESLSVSAVWGKSFHFDGQEFGHVLDPRAGAPVSNAVLAAVILPSATETDALSTALLVAGLPGHDSISALRPSMRSLVIAEGKADWNVLARGIAMQ